MVDNQCGKEGTRSSKVVARCGPLHASSLQVAYWNFVVYEDKVVNGTFSFVRPERLVCLFFCLVGTFLRASCLKVVQLARLSLRKNVSVSACGPVVFPRGLRRVFAAQQ